MLCANGYTSVEKLKDEKATALREKLNGLRKKNRMEVPALQLEEVEAWLTEC